MLHFNSTGSALTIFSLMAFLCSMTTAVTAASIYKSVDKDGNVIFTDRPLEGAENLSGEATEANSPNAAGSASANAERNDGNEKRDSVAVAPEPKNPPKSDYKEAASTEAFLPVTVVEILTPIHNATIQDPLGNIWVELQSYPTPLKKSGLTAELWMNDELVTSGQRPMLSLPKPERGTHVLQVKLIDSKGQLFLESKKVHIHVRYRVSSN